MACNSAKLPPLLEKVRERRIKSTTYNSPHPKLASSLRSPSMEKEQALV
jgi:hypothetical protein